MSLMVGRYFLKDKSHVWVATLEKKNDCRVTLDEDDDLERILREFQTEPNQNIRHQWKPEVVLAYLRAQASDVLFAPFFELQIPKEDDDEDEIVEFALTEKLREDRDANRYLEY